MYCETHIYNVTKLKIPCDADLNTRFVSKQQAKTQNSRSFHDMEISLVNVKIIIERYSLHQ